MTLGQVAEVLLIPEHERPVRRQAHGADEDDEHGRPPDLAAEEVGDAGRRRPSPSRLAACHSSVSGTARRIQRTSSAGSTPTRKTTRGLLPASSERGTRGEQDAEVDPALEHGGDPRPPPPGPRLRQQRRPDRPLAADPEGGEESDDQQLPPRLREVGQAGERRVGEDRQAERPAPPDQVADAAEEAAAERPADQERGLNPRAVAADGLVPRVRPRSARRRTARRRAHKGACRGRRTASPATPRSPDFHWCGERSRRLRISSRDESAPDSIGGFIIAPPARG